jgi:hypothetical protein
MSATMTSRNAGGASTARRASALLLAGLMASAPAAAQAPDSATLRDLARIREEGLERSQLLETLSWLTDVFGGRLTNSPSQRAAADWAEQRLRSWSIDRTWREGWGPFGQGWTSELVWLRAVEPQPFQIIANVEPWTPGTRGVVRGPALLVTNIGSAADLVPYRGRLRGAFVLLSQPPEIEPPVFQPLATRHTDAQLIEATWPFRREPRQLSPEERGARTGG